VEFVSDRPGHDLRYAIDASKTIKELGWNPISGNFEDKLREVIPFYVEKLNV
jgi:dTDP-glucose 4,6-dehydratase